MRDLFLKSAKALSKNENILSIYESLAEYYLNIGQMDGYTSSLEKIWHLNHNNELLLKISDIAKNVLKNYNLSCLFEGLYFYSQAPEHFNSFAPISGMNQGLISDIQYEANSSELKLLINRNFICDYMMLHAHQKNDLELVLELSKYLFEIKSQIDIYVQENNITESRELLSIKEDDSAVSNVLSQTKHHNDINKLAIVLNKYNEKAYLNIIDDLLVYKNFQNALDFYNNEYAPAFSKPLIHSASELCWFMSNNYSNKLEFYETLYFQKLAIELELKN